MSNPRLFQQGPRVNRRIRTDERRLVTDDRGGVWTVVKVQRKEAAEADFRFWYDGLTPEQRVEARFGGVPTRYIGLKDLISNKEATDRLQDRADVDILRRAATAKITPARSRQPRGRPRG